MNYYEFKENNPEFFENVNLKTLVKIGEDAVITVPPYREQNGRRILLYRIGKLISANIIIIKSKVLVKIIKKLIDSAVATVA